MRPTLQDVIERAWNEIANLPDYERPKISTNQLSIELAREYERDGRTPQQREETLKADIDTLFYAYSFALKKLPRYWNPEPLRHERAYSIMALCLRSILTNLLALTSGMGLYLPQDELQRYEGIELWVHDIQPYIVQTTGEKPHLNPSNDAGGQLQGNDQNKPLGAEEMPINKDMLPTIGDEETKELEQRVFLKLIEAGFMSLNADNSGYKWEKSDYDLAFLCGCLYWGDCAKEDKKEAYKSNFTKECYYLEKNRKRIERGKPDKIKKLFSGKNVPDDRYHYKEIDQSLKWKEIDKLLKEAMAEVKAGK